LINYLKGDLNAAAERLSDAIKIKPNGYYYFYLGRTYWKLGGIYTSPSLLVS